MLLVHIIGAFRILSNIKDGALCENSQRMIFNSFQLLNVFSFLQFLNVFARHSIFDVWQGFECASAYYKIIFQSLENIHSLNSLTLIHKVIKKQFACLLQMINDLDYLIIHLNGIWFCLNSGIYGKIVDTNQEYVRLLIKIVHTLM